MVSPTTGSALRSLNRPKISLDRASTFSRTPSFLNASWTAHAAAQLTALAAYVPPCEPACRERVTSVKGSSRHAGDSASEESDTERSENENAPAACP